MKRFFLVIAFLAGVVSLHAQGNDYVIELPYVVEGGRMVVRATVEGIEGRYLFDTGAPVVITNARFRQGVSSVGAQQLITDAHGQSGMVNSARLETFDVGGYAVRGINALVLEPGSILEMQGLDGIVGNNLFRPSTVRMDARRQVISITNNPARFGLNPDSAIRVFPGQTHTYIEVELGGGLKDTVMFDTGSFEFYEMVESTYERVKHAPAVETLSIGHGATGISAMGMEEAAERARVKVPDFRVGDGKFKDVVTITMQGPSSRVGARLLHHGYVTIDYPNNRFYFEPFSAEPVDMYAKEWDVQITISGDQLAAGQVWGDMLKKVTPGQIVVEVDGRRFDKVDMEDLWQNPLFQPGQDKSKIKVVDENGKERRVTIRRK